MSQTSQSHSVDPTQFAHFLIEKWQTQITIQGITDTRALLNSFTATVYRNSAGNPERIKFVFNYYGKFLDMGVFGTGSRKNNTQQKHYRTRYPWYSSIFAKQVRRLANLMAKQYGYESVTSIAESVSSKKQ